MLPEQEVAQLKELLRGQPNDDSTLPALKDYLRLINEHCTRDSLFVAARGPKLLQHSSQLSENEKWSLHEQVIEAALECGNVSLSQALLQALLRRFPDSSRVQALKGMHFEACGNYEAAQDVYNQLLKQPAGASIGLKRLAALERTQGDVPRAIEVLRKHLDVYANDKGAWEELADMYLEVGMFRQAAFCFEELLLHAPHHFHYHLRFADTLYTIGASQSIKAARAHYSEAVVLSGGKSLRALFGLVACASHANDKDGGAEITTAAAASLEAMYEASDAYKLQLVAGAIIK